MSYTCSIENKGNYLHIRIAGQNTPENIRAYLKEIYEACGRTHVPDVLIEDNLEGPPLESSEVFRITKDASAQTSPIVRKIAFVNLTPEHSLENTQLMEEVARDRGVNVRTFSTSAAAQEWLSRS